MGPPRAPHGNGGGGAGGPGRAVSTAGPPWGAGLCSLGCPRLPPSEFPLWGVGPLAPGPRGGASLLPGLPAGLPWACPVSPWGWGRLGSALCRDRLGLALRTPLRGRDGAFGFKGFPLEQWDTDHACRASGREEGLAPQPTVLGLSGWSWDILAVHPFTGVLAWLLLCCKKEPMSLKGERQS